MLRITMNKSAAGAKKYYCEEYYKEGQSAQFDYYGEGTELIGRWGGKAAERLGLKGSIDKKAFARMCDNIAPYTGKRLTGRNDSDRTVGYDFTFNASKSVSLAYAFAGTDDKKIILEAFQTAVRETMQDVESGMQARVRAKGKDENRMTGNIAYGEFTHFTTRPIDGVPDPHLHSHCFVFNATFDQTEDKWKAGQFRQVKQDAPYYEAVFQAKLARQLQRAGYGITKTRNGFELEGLEKRTLDKFSRRTQEIEVYTREHGITDEAQKAQVGARTREAKRMATITARQHALEWGSRLTEEEQTALRYLKKGPAQQEREEAACHAVQFALNHHFERKSVASDKELLATAIKRAIGVASPEQVSHAFHRDETILSVTDQLRTFITTKAALKEEKQLIQYGMLTRNKFRPIHEEYEAKNKQLNDQQKAAVKHALSSTDGVILITGKAGTGKTTLMKEIKRGIEASDKQIFAFAPSSEASRGVQRSEGFANAETVAKLIQQSGEHPNFKHQVIWVDEAGMLSNRDMNHILTIANAQSARVILSGDTRQHTSVERGDAMRILQQEAGIKPITIDKIQRQKDTVYKEAVQLLSDGKVKQGFTKLERSGAIHEITDPSTRLDALADDYYRSSHAGPTHRDVLVVAPTHAEGEVVTRTIRERLKAEKVIGQKERSYTVFRNKQLTEAEKQEPEQYQPGDWVVFHQNTKGIKAGSRFEVKQAGDQGIIAADTNGLERTLALSDAEKYNLFEQREIALSDGDKLRVTANGKSVEGKHLFNGSVFQIKGFKENGDVRLSNGATLPSDFGHFNLGYVSTSHASQGKTADKVIISQSAATFRAASMEQFYVSVSRGREAVSIYTDDKEHLLDAVSRSTERQSATELMAKTQQQGWEAKRMTEFKNPLQHIPYHYHPHQQQNRDYEL